MQSKPEPEVVLAAILDPKSAKSPKNDYKWHQMARITTPASTMLTSLTYRLKALDRK